MTNTNLFRKGLATSAIAALGVSVLTGVAPASAVDPAVSLELSHGTSTNVKTWDFAEFESGFSLAANPFDQCSYETGSGGGTWVTADCNYSVMPVSYLIESLDGADVYAAAFDSDNSEDATHGDFDPYAATEDYYSNGAWDNLDDQLFWGLDTNITTDSEVIDGGYYHDVTNRLILDLNDATHDKASRVRVTAFLDHNGDNEITTGTDEATAPVTITFNRPEDLSAVTTLTQPIVGDDYLNAETTVSPVLNDDFSYGPGTDNGNYNNADYYYDADMVIDFTVENYYDNSDQYGHNVSTVDFATNSDGKYVAEEDDIYNGDYNLWYVEAGNYEAQLFVYGEAVGNIDRKVVAARHFNDAAFSSVENDNVNFYAADWTYTADYYSGYYTEDYAEVRAGSGAQTYTVTSYDDEGNLNPAGTKLNLLVDNLYNWQSTSDFEVKVNGSAVDEGDKVELTVGADGKVNFTVSNVSDEREAAWDWAGFLIESAEGNWVSDHALLVQWTPSYFRTFDSKADRYTNNRNLVSGGSYTFNLVVADQWGVAPANGEYRVAADYDGRIDQDVTATDLVNGRASVTVTDNASTAVQARDGYVFFTIEKLVNLGTELYPNKVWETVNDGSVESWEHGSYYENMFRTTYYVQPAGRIVFDDSEDYNGLTAIAAEGAFLPDNDNRGKRWSGSDDLTLCDMAANCDESSDDSQLGEWEGYVLNSVTDIARVGAEVTISSPDLVFGNYEKGDNKFSKGTITTFADDEGWFEFYFVGHRKGNHNITITSGGVSITVVAVLENLAAANVAVSQVANSQAGKTLVSTATVTDKWGNSVDEGAVTFASNFGTVPVASVNLDDNGVAVGNVEVGTNDLGTATVTATAGEAVGTATTTFGTTDGHVFKNKKRVTATWEFAKGKTVAIYRDGRRVRNIPVATDDAGKFSFNVKKGKHTVTLKIAGAVVYSYTFNVK